MNLHGRTVLVTGGTAGIGEAFVRALVDRDCTAILCGRDPERLGAAAEASPSVHAIQCDLAHRAERRELILRLQREHGDLSLLINNAGVQFDYNWFDIEPEAVVERSVTEIETNLVAVVELTALLLPLLARQPDAAIVNVSSGLALAPKKGAPVYCATKAAVHTLSQALRYQLAERAPHVRLFEILPPLVDTAMTAGRGTGKLSPEEVVRQALRGIERDLLEVRVGKVRLLAALLRIAPGLARRKMRDY
jgi:uncharacterized oxidoreductase